MIFTLTLFVASSLTGVATFRVLQARVVETLQQRLYTRIALGFTLLLPQLRDDTFAPQQAHRFMEADLLTRALVAMLADLFNVAVVGTIAMTMLVLFHPYFVAYILVLILGFVGLLTLFGRGGFFITLEMSRLHYEIFGWIQNILNVDTLARRMVAMFFTFVSCREIAGLFSLPTEEQGAKEDVPAAQFGSSGIHVTCRNLSCTAPDGRPVFQNVCLDVAPGEKIAILCSTNRAKTAALTKVLAGLHPQRPDSSGTMT